MKVAQKIVSFIGLNIARPLFDKSCYANSGIWASESVIKMTGDFFNFCYNFCHNSKNN